MGETVVLLIGLEITLTNWVYTVQIGTVPHWCAIGQHLDHTFHQIGRSVDIISLHYIVRIQSILILFLFHTFKK